MNSRRILSSSETVSESPTLDNARCLILEHWGLLDRLAQRRFPDSNTADEALLYVSRALEANGWKRVHAYKGQCRFSTFISHIAVRLMEDFARLKFGRKRPPIWIQRQGTIWMEVYRLLCVEHMTKTDIIESLNGSGKEERGRMIIEEAVGVILARVNDCGKRPGEMVTMDPSVLTNTMDKDLREQSFSPEDLYVAKERISILDFLGYCLISEEGGKSPRFPAEEKVWQMVLCMNSLLSFSSEDRLLLKMVYRDGLSVVEAGRMLSLRIHQVHGRLRRLLASIRKALEKCDLHRELKVLLRE